jgi:DNA-binding CsgD family transcriptional regulator
MAQGLDVNSAVLERDTELAAVERLLDAIEVANGALVVEGSAGVGKTTMWREGLARAANRGARVLASRPAEAEATLSYAALADLLGAAYDDARGNLPAPQQQALDVALARAKTGGGADARMTALAFLGVLGDLARAGPVLLAVDDVQWLDRASERVLEFAARRLPAQVGVFLTRRSDGGGDPPLGLSRALPDTMERLVLGPLSLAALHHMIKNQFGWVPPRPVLVRIEAASGGNPFYALEIARNLARDRASLTPGDRLPIPDSLQELVMTRVRTLSTAAQATALACAALSRPTVPTIAGALEAGDDAEAAIIEAEEAGVLVSDKERIRFAHPLLASAVYASASDTRRRLLHRRLAGIVSDPEERARHRAKSATEASESDAVEIERAADLAARRGAQDAAAELYEAAGRLTPDDRLDDRSRRLLGEAAALLAAGDLPGARSVAETTLEQSDSATRRAEALFLLSQIAWVERPGLPPVAYLERALKEAGGDRRLRGRIHAKLAEFSLLDHEGVLRHVDAAAELLDEERDPALLSHALMNKVFFSANVGRPASGDLLDRALQLEKRAGPEDERSRVALIWFTCMDEPESARARHAFEDKWYRDRGEEAWRAERLAFLALAEFNAGNWRPAQHAIDESCAVLDELGALGGPWGIALFVRSLVDMHSGRIERARDTLRLLVEESEQDGNPFFAGIFLSQLGSAELAAGDPEAADHSFLRSREHLDAVGAVDPIGARTEPPHVEALLALGQLERARRVLDQLEWRGRTLPRPWISAALPRVRALIRAAEGDTAGALDELGELDADAAARVPFEHGRTMLLKGQLQRRLKQKRAAADTLAATLEIFERVGAPMWAEQAQGELDRIGLRRSPDGLTVTELRVAELAAGGMTNREVAAAAFMSPRTVEANLARVYRKLGIRSRAELGARMASVQRDVQT